MKDELLEKFMEIKDEEKHLALLEVDRKADVLFEYLCGCKIMCQKNSKEFFAFDGALIRVLELHDAIVGLKDMYEDE